MSYKENDPNWEKSEPYFREENIMVFYKYLGHPEKLLYNFNLALGDTLSDSFKGYYEVKKIDTITTDDGLQRKRLYLDKICKGEPYDKTTWIEGLGNVETYEYRDACLIIDPESAFICASHNGKVIYAVSYCKTVGTSSDIVEHVIIYPNPVTDFLTLDGEVGDIQKVQIYDANALLVETYKFNKISKSIDIGHLKPGLHLLSIITNQGKAHLIKFVKI